MIALTDGGKLTNPQAVENEVRQGVWLVGGALVNAWGVGWVWLGQ